MTRRTTDDGALAERISAFRRALEKKGLSLTSQREEIARILFSSDGHLSVDDLHQAAREVDAGVGYATVHRTIKLLQDLDLAEERHFGGDRARYERTDGEDGHHAHLLCDGCGRVVEFRDARLETLQEDVAARHGFVLARPHVELYGLCPDCRESPERS